MQFNQSVSVYYQHTSGLETSPFVFDIKEFRGDNWDKEAVKKANGMCGLTRFESWRPIVFKNK